MTTYTLVYFQPSSRGYDYTYGFRDSDNELSIFSSDNYQDLVKHLAQIQFGVYSRNETRPSFDLCESEYSYALLVDGKNSDEVDVEPVEFYSSLSHLFDEYVKSDYSKLVSEYDTERECKLNKQREEEAQQKRNERLRKYEELKKEFDSK